jgi:transposase
MFPELAEIKIYLRPGHTDMRKAVNGLSAIIVDLMESDPLSGSLFLFCNRERKLLKAVWWDKNGFCLWQKRLEKHKFPWPVSEAAARELSMDELAMLLKGIDFWKAHTPVNYSKVS